MPNFFLSKTENLLKKRVKNLDNPALALGAGQLNEGKVHDGLLLRVQLTRHL